MATPLSYLYTERWRDWKVAYKALQPSRTNDFRSSNVLSFSSSLPRFQAPNPSTPVPFVLFVTRTCLWAQWLCWSFLCSSCQFKRLPKHIRRSCYCFSSLWYILSFFSWKNKKWNLLTIFFPKLKLLWMSAGTNQCRCILFPEVQVSYCISQRYMYYITEVEVMMEPIHRENLASFEVNASSVIKVIHRILLNFWQGHWCYT